MNILTQIYRLLCGLNCWLCLGSGTSSKGDTCVLCKGTGKLPKPPKP